MGTENELRVGEEGFEEIKRERQIKAEGEREERKTIEKAGWG